jgi:AcrR family transcriptional regulator
VSPAAPYRHFRDRDELLASVALRGFERFAMVLEQAWDDGRPQPLAALDRLGKADLQFARAEPACYSAMFEAGIPLTASPELREAAERAFAVLRGASETLCAQMPLQSRPPPLWSLCISGQRHTASPRCSAVATRHGGRCQCRPKSCWRRECWSTCVALDYLQRREPMLSSCPVSQGYSLEARGGPP